PLDGSRILGWLLPPRWAGMMDRIEQYGGMGLMLVLYLLSRFGILSKFISPLLLFMIRALLIY
ncbi:MAG: site-2 protease family protein, partial [Chloroflexota bacterium]|nr:site-2 protease family protein [Chloroflexota bacterium]